MLGPELLIPQAILHKQNTHMTYLQILSCWSKHPLHLLKYIPKTAKKVIYLYTQETKLTRTLLKQFIFSVGLHLSFKLDNSLA